MPRPLARELVTQEAARALGEGRFLINLLREDMGRAVPANTIDWAALSRPETCSID